MCLHVALWLCVVTWMLMWEIATTTGLNNTDRWTITCHKNYYSWPVCVDEQDGYSCDCGPGFYWNTKSCLATSVDSRFEFSALEPIRYALLQNKPFPALNQFTIAMWLKVYDSSHSGTIISYKLADELDVFTMVSGPKLRMTLDGDVITSIPLPPHQWTHVAWTYSSCVHKVYINGTLQKVNASRLDEEPRRRRCVAAEIAEGGELILGQSSRNKQNIFINAMSAFLGEMAFVNIWKYAMNETQVTHIQTDCLQYMCGDGIEWVDFRSGTYGAMKLRWPSGITEVVKRGSRPCFSVQSAVSECRRFCSDTIGARCNAEILNNIQWSRTKANTTDTVLCPGQDPYDNHTKVYAYRSCVRLNENGRWAEPKLTDCLSEHERFLQTQLEKLSKNNTYTEERTRSKIKKLIRNLASHTNTTSYRNIMDLAACVGNVHGLILAMNQTLRRSTTVRYTLERPDRYPGIDETREISDGFANIFNNLLSDRNEASWAATKPRGSQGDHFVSVLETLFVLLSDYLRRNRLKGEFLTMRDAFVHKEKGKIEFKTLLYSPGDAGALRFPSVPRSRGKQHPTPYPHAAAKPSQILLPRYLYNLTSAQGYIPLTVGKLSVPKILPNHDVARRSKEDNVNSELFLFHPHTNHSFSYGQPLPRPIELHLTYLNNFNISNPECVRLVHSIGATSWYWSRDGCELVHNTSTHAECICTVSGMYAVTTDMYNIHWDPGIEPMILMQVPSYIGCSISAALCLLSCLLLIYLRTASSTATIHKNFALAIVSSQVTFMVGIDKTDQPMLCQCLAIAFHYFFLATFSWLMNEAFNLYIVITYAAHSNTEHDEGGSQWRYFLLGWVLPGVMVGAFVGTHTDDYYAPDMCWISWQYLWLFLGPAIGIISITILVLVFTAKEVNESSYSKNEKTNKMINIHSKALWTQVILLSVCWSFAFLTLRMRGIILKVLYGLFNGLQGSFFCVFYFLLNEEVRSVYLNRQKRKSLAKQGYELTPAQSMDSIYGHEMVPMDIEQENMYPEACTSADDSSVNLKKKHVESKKKRKRSQIEATSSEDSESDCEVMITSV